MVLLRAVHFIPLTGAFVSSTAELPGDRVHLGFGKFADDVASTFADHEPDRLLKSYDRSDDKLPALLQPQGMAPNTSKQVSTACFRDRKARAWTHYFYGPTCTELHGTASPVARYLGGWLHYHLSLFKLNLFHWSIRVVAQTTGTF